MDLQVKCIGHQCVSRQLFLPSPPRACVVQAALCLWHWCNCSCKCSCCREACSIPASGNCQASTRSCRDPRQWLPARTAEQLATRTLDLPTFSPPLFRRQLEAVVHIPLCQPGPIWWACVITAERRGPAQLGIVRPVGRRPHGTRRHTFDAYKASMRSATPNEAPRVCLRVCLAWVAGLPSNGTASITHATRVASGTYCKTSSSWSSVRT
eukprot:364337-Chlamydomonas_euryale.AAC.14